MVLWIIHKPKNKTLAEYKECAFDAVTNESKSNHRAEQRPDMKTLIFAHICGKDVKEIDEGYLCDNFYKGIQIKKKPDRKRLQMFCP